MGFERKRFFPTQWYAHGAGNWVNRVDMCRRLSEIANSRGCQKGIQLHSTVARRTGAGGYHIMRIRPRMPWGLFGGDQSYPGIRPDPSPITASRCNMKGIVETGARE